MIRTIISYTFVAFLLAITASEAEPFVHQSLSSADDNTVNVRIFDDATDGCWTNLGEVRTYAEDSLREAGYEIAPEEEATFDFTVSVWGYRRNEIGCLGVIEVDVSTAGWVLLLDSYARAIVASNRRLPSGFQNLNNSVLNGVGELAKAISR